MQTIAPILPPLYRYPLAFVLVILLNLPACEKSRGPINEPIPREFRAANENSFGEKYARILRNDVQLDSLPGYVPRQRTPSLNLIADYSKTAKDYILLYLINDTQDSIVLKEQDGDLYIKFEVADSSGGRWMRAQSHMYSWCGNSYGQTILHAGRFLIYRGIYPTHGVPKMLRYRMYDGKNNNVISNVGSGLVSQGMIDSASFDQMAFRVGDSLFIYKCATGELTASNNLVELSHFGIRVSALDELYRFPSQATTEILSNTLNDTLLDDNCRWAAIRSLRKMRGPSSITLLRDVVYRPLLTEKLAREAFEALNDLSKDSAAAFIRAALSDRHLLHRSAILSITSNAFRLENEGERIEQINKRVWSADSLAFKSTHHETLDEADMYWRSHYPNHYKFYLLDPGLRKQIFDCVGDFSDSSSKDILTCYAEYNTADLRNYLRGISLNSSLPESIRSHAAQLYEEHFPNKTFVLSIDFLRQDPALSETTTVPFHYQIRNISLDTIRYSLDTLIHYFSMEMKIRYMGKQGTSETYSTQTVGMKDIRFTGGSNSGPAGTPIVVVPPGAAYDFNVVVNVDSHLVPRRKGSYWVDVNSSALIPNLSDVPRRSNISSSLTFR